MYFKKIIKKFWFLIIIFIIPIPSIFWLPRNEVFAHGLILPWAPANIMFENATNYLFMWSDHIGFGNINTEPSGFMYYIIAFLAIAIGGSSHIGQVIFLYLGFVGCISSMFIFSRVLGFNKVSSLFAGIFYLLSPMVMSGMPIEITNLRLLPYYIATPILFSIIVYATRLPHNRNALALFGVASILFGSAGYSGLQYLSLHLIFIVVYGVYVIVVKWSNRGSWLYAVRRLALIVIVMFLINLYWLIPIIFNLSEAYAMRAEPGLSDLAIIEGLSVKLIDFFRMLPYPAQANYSPWIAYYYTTALTIIAFCLMVIGISPLFTRIRQYAILPGLLFIIAMFLAKGVQEPFGWVGERLFLTFPYITRLFRNPTYFGILGVIALALLFGLGTGQIIRIVSNKSWKYSIIVIILFVIILGTFGWQFLIGGPVKSQLPNQPSQSIKVPEYYMELVKYLRNDSDEYRIVSMPIFFDKEIFTAYSWEKLFFSKPPPLNVWSGKAVFRPVFTVNNGFNQVFDSVMHPQSDIISQILWIEILQKTNIRYITFHRDTNWEYLDGMNLEFDSNKISDFINKNPYVEKISNFGEIDLYEINENYFLPRFYIPQRIISTDDIIEDLANTLDPDNFLLRSGIYFSNINDNSINAVSENLDKNEFFPSELPEDEIPKITFVKINPTKYRIKVENAKKPYVIIFQENFSKNWKLYVNKNMSNWVNHEKVYGKERTSYFEGQIEEGEHRNNFLELATFETWNMRPIAESSHVIINGFANSWFIKPSDVGELENYELIIEFLPQKIFLIGLLVSVLTFMICLVYVIYIKQNRRKRLHN